MSQVSRSVRWRLPSSRQASSSASLNGSSIPPLPPKPAIDYSYLIANRTACAKNLADRKSHLTPDAIEDIAYLYGESRNLSKKLAEARHRQNSLGNKIKEAVRSVKPAKSDEQWTTNDPDDLLLTPDTASKKNHGEVGGLSSLALAAKVKDYHAEAATLKDAIATLSKDGVTLEQRLLNLAGQIPNTIHPNVPAGPYSQSEVISSSSGSNLVANPPPFHSFGEPCRTPDTTRDHLNVMTELGWLSFSDGQRTTGPSFPFLVGHGAFLELALTQYAISLAVRSGWNLTIGPDLVRTELSDRCGFSPRDGGESNQTYFVSTHKVISASEFNSSDEQPKQPPLPTLCLSATAEIPLVGSHHSMTLPNQTYPEFPLQPIQLVSLGTAFRAEAGSRGSESRGLYRVHQFKKVELVAITDSNIRTSENMLQKMLELQIKIVEGLDLPYRVLEMSSEELGASAHHKYDIETWMPGRGRWGEVSSASNCTDYQSRRLGIRYRSQDACLGSHVVLAATEEKIQHATSSVSSPVSTKKNDKPLYAHTLNATAAAMPRLIVSLIENGVILDQKNKPVGIELPTALKPYWLGGTSQVRWT